MNWEKGEQHISWHIPHDFCFAIAKILRKVKKEKEV